MGKLGEQGEQRQEGELWLLLSSETGIQCCEASDSFVRGYSDSPDCNDWLLVGYVTRYVDTMIL